MSESKLVFKADTAQATSSIKGLKNTLGGLKTAANGVGSAFKAALLPLTAIAAIAGGTVFGVKGIIDFAGHLQDLSGVTGVAVKDLVILEEQFRAAGAPVEKLDSLFVKLSNSLEAPSADVGKWLKEFGITAEEIAGLDLAQRFQLIGSKIGGLATESEKASAATEFFGKQGKDLVNMFSDPNGFENAKKFVGGLADTMDRTASRLESAGDSIDGIKVKLQQFFAAFTERNLMNIEKIAEIISNLDLSELGGNVGSVTGGLFAAFEDGNLGKALWVGLKGAFLKIGEILLSIMDMAGTVFAGSIVKSLKGTKLGDVLAASIKIQPESFETVYKRHNGELGSLMAFKEFEDFGRKTTDEDAKRAQQSAADSQAKREAQATEARAKAREASFQGEIKRLGESLINQNLNVPILSDVLAFAQDPKADYEKLPTQFNPTRPNMVGRLASMGGARGESAGLNPLIKIQREQLKVLNSINTNTRGIGGASSFA